MWVGLLLVHISVTLLINISVLAFRNLLIVDIVVFISPAFNPMQSAISQLIYCYFCWLRIGFQVYLPNLCCFFTAKTSTYLLILNLLGQLDKVARIYHSAWILDYSQSSLPLFSSAFYIFSPCSNLESSKGFRVLILSYSTLPECCSFRYSDFESTFASVATAKSRTSAGA